MPNVPFHYVDVRTFAYATEDEKRVEQALRHFLPEDTDVERTASEGHHGDRIAVLSARLENADEVRFALSHVANLDDVDALVDELDDRVTENCEFFLHLDKQAAFSGETQRGTGITFRAKVEAYPAKREKAIENAQRTLEELEEHEVAVADDDSSEDAASAADHDSSEEANSATDEAGDGEA